MIVDIDNVHILSGIQNQSTDPIITVGKAVP